MMNCLKCLCLSLLLLCIVTISFSQKKNTLTFSVGASLPLGSFANTSSTAPGISPGFAGTGIFADVLFKRKIALSPFAIAGLLGLNVNFLKINKIIENYQGNNLNFKWTGKHSNWLSIAAMPGLCYSRDISKKVVFTAALFTGPAVAHSPGFTLKGAYNENGYYSNAESYQKDRWTLTVVSRLHTEAQFKINKKTNLVVQAAYNYLKPTFTKIVQKYNQMSGPTGSPFTQVSSSFSEFTYIQNMSTVNVGAGIVMGL